MTYRDDITALNPDHFWPLEADSADDVGSQNGTDTSVGYGGAAICEDATAASVFNATSDRIAFGTGTSTGALDRKAVCGWFRVNSIQPPPKSIYREGTTGNQFNLVLWAGNNIMLDVVNGSTVVQAFADQVAEPNRTYHIFARVEGTGFGNKVELYIDGVKQSITSPANGQLGAATLGNRAAIEMGDPSGSTEVGNTTVLLNCCVTANHNFWASWTGANAASLTDTQIREELFEKGALPGTTIAFTNQTTMQTALDALADTVRPDEPLNIRIEGDAAPAATGDSGLRTGSDERTALRIGDAGWNNPANVRINDNLYATTSLFNTGSVSDSIDVTNFSFDELIPEGATIAGVEVTVRAEADDLGIRHNIEEVFLIIDDVAQTTEIKSDAGPIGTTETVYTFGGPTDLWSLGSISRTDVVASGFGAGIAIGNNVATQLVETVSVDSIEVTVYYNEASSISYVHLTEADTGNTTSWSVAYPENIQSGDLLILAATTDGNLPLNAPAGWTEQVRNNTTEDNYSQYIYTKIADGTETGNLSLTNASSESGLATITRVVGAATPYTISVVSANVSALGNSATIPTTTTTENDAFVFALTTVSEGDRLFTFPGGSWEERSNVGALASQGPANASTSLAVATYTQSTSGTTENGTVTWDGATAYGVTHVLVIEPNAAGNGATDITLTADNITHDEKASIHVQWTGEGTLTWVNENGSNASIGSTPNGGTLDFVEAVNLVVSVRDASTGAPIQNARVLLLADSGGPIAQGTTILEGLTNVAGELTGTLQYSADQPVTGRVRKATSSPYYKTSEIVGTITSAGLETIIQMVSDE